MLSRGCCPLLTSRREADLLLLMSHCQDSDRTWFFALVSFFFTEVEHTAIKMESRALLSRDKAERCITQTGSIQEDLDGPNTGTSAQAPAPILWRAIVVLVLGVLTLSVVVPCAFGPDRLLVARPVPGRSISPVRTMPVRRYNTHLRHAGVPLRTRIYAMHLTNGQACATSRCTSRGPTSPSPRCTC